MPNAARCHVLPSSPARLIAAVLAALSMAAVQAASPPAPQGAGENPAPSQGVEFTVPEVDDLADFHGSLADPRLVLYVAGNSFFAMTPLVHAFESRYPDYRGKVYFETLPPGILAQQLEAGGTITSGNMTWTVKADAFLAGMDAVKTMIAGGALAGPPVAYATNELAIMVAKGNPRGIAGLKDLGRPDLRLAMPNLQTEGVARQIQLSLVKAGGEPLRAAVYETKVADGSTTLTQIHHRQTPMFILQGQADAGVTWQSEVVNQQRQGRPIDGVGIAAAENSTGIYGAALVRDAPHPAAARDWLAFIATPEAFRILESFGFKPPGAAAR